MQILWLIAGGFFCETETILTISKKCPKRASKKPMNILTISASRNITEFHNLKSPKLVMWVFAILPSFEKV